MLIIGIILWGMLIGAAAQLLLGANKHGGVNWTVALAAGIVGSFLGGLIIGLITGHGFEFRPSGIIGSLVGALILTALWVWFDRNKGNPALMADAGKGDS
ncbi:hypothetical protein GOHSU_02_01600 [Gordonia hirsuta DSM 44140 = NBRC 16056]|uniref:GlsB/YeaQ/YmgE family stress response membrane protein n=1 Tax=Gordonia hirsuta DSM 44140 = NBRC 16056 TaxID=1121927 RepID=L7L517_9ACTN|nr:GlsB/YeaQ/YmgE family stress response membrane protein [Gordonia hirsuta]GAC56014.1 hypothetical protein GOHSU_02_01600 [Gordonia hirsuta DSM 44140 = NBRC 16056]